MNVNVREFLILAAGAIALASVVGGLTWYVMTTYIVPPNLNDPYIRQKYEERRQRAD